MANRVLKGDWLVEDLENNKNWLFNLEKKDREEIKNATKTSLSLGKKIYDVSHKDFPLKELSSKLNKIQNQLTITQRT